MRARLASSSLELKLGRTLEAECGIVAFDAAHLALAEPDDGRGDVREPADEVRALLAKDGCAGPSLVQLNSITIELQLELPIGAGRRRCSQLRQGRRDELNA